MSLCSPLGFPSRAPSTLHLLAVAAALLSRASGAVEAVATAVPVPAGVYAAMRTGSVILDRDYSLHPLAPGMLTPMPSDLSVCGTGREACYPLGGADRKVVTLREGGTAITNARSPKFLLDYAGTPVHHDHTQLLPESLLQALHALDPRGGFQACLSGGQLQAVEPHLVSYGTYGARGCCRCNKADRIIVARPSWLILLVSGVAHSVATAFAPLQLPELTIEACPTLSEATEKKAARRRSTVGCTFGGLDLQTYDDVHSALLALNEPGLLRSFALHLQPPEGARLWTGGATGTSHQTCPVGQRCVAADASRQSPLVFDEWRAWTYAQQTRFLDNFAKFWISAASEEGRGLAKPGSLASIAGGTTDYVLEMLNRQKFRLSARKGSTRTEYRKLRATYDYVSSIASKALPNLDAEHE